MILEKNLYIKRKVHVSCWLIFRRAILFLLDVLTLKKERWPLLESARPYKVVKKNGYTYLIQSLDRQEEIKEEIKKESDHRQPLAFRKGSQD